MSVVCAGLINGGAGERGKGSDLGQDQNRTDELTTALRQRFAAFEASNDRQNRVTAVNSVVNLADALLEQDAEIPKQREQQQHGQVRHAAEQGENALNLAALVCLVAVLAVGATVLWGSTPWWALLFGAPVLVLGGFLLGAGEVTQQRIAHDPRGHVVTSWGIAGLTIAADVLYVLAALQGSTAVASWLVPLLLGALAALIVQGRRPQSGEQPYRIPARS